MKQYKSVISLSKNGRGIWDFDTTKGCSNGIAQMGERGCYDDCYAARSAKIRGYDFGKTVLRDFTGVAHQRKVIDQINRIDSSFIRIGCSGDPSEDWNHTFSILRKIARCDKEIVIITKHWHVMTDQQIHELKALRVHVNTSVSALDSPAQLEKCLLEYWRLKPFCKSFLRVVSCDFNKSNPEGLRLSIIQDSLFENEHVIDTVFRPSKNNKLILDGVINAKIGRFMKSKGLLSKHNRKTYTGACEKCAEQCGVFKDPIRTSTVRQLKLF